MDKITVYCSITSECNPDEDVGVNAPSRSEITSSNTYSLRVDWDVVLYRLVKNLETYYGYPFSKKKLHEFAENYGN